jgi:hypothetical protein
VLPAQCCPRSAARAGRAAGGSLPIVADFVLTAAREQNGSAR